MRPITNRTLCIACLAAFLLASCAGRRHVTNTTSRHRTHTTDRDTDRHFVEEYSAKLGIQLDKGCDHKLIKAVSGWLGTPYKYGGESHSGTDCSGFVGQVYKEVYGISVERSANGLYESSQKISRKELKEGDLVFFKINTAKVGHVGIYITNGYFVHASTKRGVMVNNLDETYYAKYYFAAGRIKAR